MWRWPSCLKNYAPLFKNKRGYTLTSKNLRRYATLTQAISNKMIPSSARERRTEGRVSGEGEGMGCGWDKGSGGKQTVVGRVQARENRGARYRVTNSATPEIHPFIGARTHTRYADVYRRKPRPPTRISILSHHRRPWGSGNRTTQCATEIHEKKWQVGFTVTPTGETETDILRASRERERERTGKAPGGKAMGKRGEWNEKEKRFYAFLYI